MGDCDETRGSVNAAATERTIIDQQGTRGRCASGVVLWCVRADIQAGLREGREGGRRASKEGNIAGAGEKRREAEWRGGVWMGPQVTCERFARNEIGMPMAGRSVIWWIF
jgi:hypothetical protein